MNERTEPSDQLEWVSDFMREVQKDYLLWDKEYGGAHEIVFAEGDYIIDEGEEDEETVDYQEVCFWDGEQLQTIGDDHVYHDRDNAVEAAFAIFDNLQKMHPDQILFTGVDPHTIKPLGRAVHVLAFRHPDNEWGSACTIEQTVWVNKLGWAVFVRRDLLEGSNMVIHKYKGTELQEEAEYRRL